MTRLRRHPDTHSVATLTLLSLRHPQIPEPVPRSVRGGHPAREALRVRIAIVGISGSGKTTLARKVAAKLRIPHVEIDAAFHLEGWEPNPNFLDDLAARLDTPHWVCDGNYRPAEELVRGNADTIVCFDLPRRQVMRQVIVRTIRRAITREELWNGNREPASNFFRWNPEDNIIRWTWVYHGHRKQKMLESERTGAWNHADVVWLRSHAEADAWLDSLPSPPIS